MQSGIQGTARHLHNIAGNLLQPLRDGITMHRLNGDDFQDEQVQRTLREIGFRREIGYSFHFYLFILPAQIEAQPIHWVLQGQRRRSAPHLSVFADGCVQ